MARRQPESAFKEERGDEQHEQHVGADEHRRRQVHVSDHEAGHDESNGVRHAQLLGHDRHGRGHEHESEREAERRHSVGGGPGRPSLTLPRKITVPVRRHR